MYSVIGTYLFTYDVLRSKSRSILNGRRLYLVINNYMQNLVSVSENLD